MTDAGRRFIKSSSTSTSVTNSRGELEKMLTRYGCTQFAVHHDYAASRTVVTFVVPDELAEGAPKIPVRLEVNARRVYDALYGEPKVWGGTSKAWVHNPQGYGAQGLAQADRVAWRQLILWVDAALSASSAGLQKISEAFLAHTLIRGGDGEVRKVVDHMSVAAGGNWRALLAPPKDG